ncbi:diaminopimelate epimerase [Aquibacillus sp. 3ASR75-11]|uniref:Diaminopimelate epimerase n=1 Tax=Terrihalobacillus insolitus TaxID=2950438 RepID=A0A9X3WMT3_9BACI|nr:diaminopimelate epimerase [Terrihalobacillus insolitus]MDC3412370.1 diaminopimelate epimerase [Terrihalobacillus insolitus]MDC3422937.1 diaminopimelate epimerase [Terrihalobacillus insolitus]
MEITYIKMHGLGNSYIFVDLFQSNFDESIFAPLAKSVSDVNTGIGSDGLILIHPSDKADVGMRIFNKDGSEGRNCGNGLRCVAKYAYQNRIVANKAFTIETKANNVQAHVHEVNNYVDEVTIDMGEPILTRNNIPMKGTSSDTVVNEPFTIDDKSMNITAVSMGNPHAIFFVEKIEDAPLYELGPRITKDDRFPEGVNVEFVEVVSDTELNFRVWERGSGVTQACGTGACASVVAAVLNGHVLRDKEICVHLSGGDLYVKWANDGHVWMRGRADTTSTGMYYWNR